MEERQQNYTIAEGFELPSKGLIYEKEVNPHVELRSFTARDEMKRLAPSTSQFKVLADIIEGCMLEKPAIHVYDMALGDYEFLLHKARIISYGDLYKMTIQCPGCGETVNAETHLNELEVKEYDQEAISALQNITLPDCGAKITLNFITPRMLDERETRVKERKRKAQGQAIDFKTLITLLQVIDLVDGEKLGDTKLEAFINTKLTAKDMYKIIQSADKLSNSIGLDTRIYATCPECGVEFETFFRFGLDFLRPVID